MSEKILPLKRNFNNYINATIKGVIFTASIASIAAEATNLFLRENGQEVLKVMEPQLKRKLSVLFAGIVNQLLRNVPVEVFLLP